MAQDPFSDVLALMSTKSVVSGGFVAGGRWAIRFPPPDKIKFFVTVRGECWIDVEGEGGPIRFRQGDVFLLSAARPFVISSDLDCEPVDAATLFAYGETRMVRVGEGDEFLFLGGHVQLESASGRLLMDHLPPAIHVRAGTEEATTLQWLIDQLVHEHGSDRPGSDFAAAQIAQLMFLQVLRAHLGNGDAMAAGHLRAISDPRIAPAMRLMHAEPNRSWHLTDLAKAAAMSRTAFALYFKSVAGVAPLTYLTQWRMRLAERALGNTDVPVSRLAESLGYSSESSFSTAFKRVMGRAPKRYRDALRRAAAQGA